MKVTLSFKSPFIVGGKKLTNNYIESLDYIKGNVVRAAFAKYILENCIEYKEDDIVKVDGVERKNWVYYRNKKGCVSCKLKGLCKNFSNAKFMYFYPKGVKIVPLTLMRCKQNPNHKFIDCLIQDKVCKQCDDKNGRVEFFNGYLKDNKEYSVRKMIVTKNSINKYTETSKDGFLYSLVSVSGTDDNENVFTGSIYGFNAEDLNEIKQLRLGSYTSIGYGLCLLSYENNYVKDKNKILQNLKKFNRQYKKHNKIKEECNYFAIKFTSDGKLNFTIKQSYNTTDEYMKMWENALGLNDEYKIDKVYSDTFVYRGYDQSKNSEDKREEPCEMIVKGSVIVFKTHNDFNKVILDFDKIKGFGNENENGFGDYEFYFGGVSNER
ncbi:hypothetical protein [Clostridium sp.]|jgi:CRISPR-associated protein Csx10|uniref:hypothetical protein n=1 Tax=Clostridium sp. TaxID=1506 RepID=UPI003A222725